MTKLRCRIFIKLEYVDGIEGMNNAIEAWLEKHKVGAEDIVKITQTESATHSAWNVTISVWYIERPEDRDWLTDNLSKTNEMTNPRPGSEYGV